jgi:hypothetical protein
MGASDSKLVFKQGIFKLSEDKAIAADDEYWTGVCSLSMIPLLYHILIGVCIVLGASRIRRRRLHPLLAHRHPPNKRQQPRELGNAHTCCDIQALHTS